MYENLKKRGKCYQTSKIGRRKKKIEVRFLWKSWLGDQGQLDEAAMSVVFFKVLLLG
jgi:hypothetical protein